MIKRAHIEAALLTTGMLLATGPAKSAEPTDEMRMFARMFTSLEARDVKGYCTAMHGEQYAGYLGRVCLSAVQNRLKNSEECSQDSIAQQAKAEAAKCLAMPPEEFDKAVARGVEGRKAFLQRAASQGVDGEKLLKDERAKRRMLAMFEAKMAYVQSPKELVLSDYEARWFQTTEYATYDKESPNVKAAAEFAVSAHSAVVGADLKLLSVKGARMAGTRYSNFARNPPYELWLHILKNDSRQDAFADVRRNSDGSFNLLTWHWHGEASPYAERQLNQ